MSIRKLSYHNGSVQGAAATGARATGAAATGAFAIGAMAFGAVALGALAIGRLAIGRAKIGRVEIGELSVGTLRIGEGGPNEQAVIIRIRAAPGQGDAMERFLVELDDPQGKVARRSTRDPDLFLVEARNADGGCMDYLSRKVVEAGLIDGAVDDAIDVEIVRTLSS